MIVRRGSSNFQVPYLPSLECLYQNEPNVFARSLDFIGATKQSPRLLRYARDDIND